MTAGRLKLREFAGESTGPHLLITGGVHGDEFENPSPRFENCRRLLW